MDIQEELICSFARLGSTRMVNYALSRGVKVSVALLLSAFENKSDKKDAINEMLNGILHHEKTKQMPIEHVETILRTLKGTCEEKFIFVAKCLVRRRENESLTEINAETYESVNHLYRSIQYLYIVEKVQDREPSWTCDSIYKTYENCKDVFQWCADDDLWMQYLWCRSHGCPEDDEVTLLFQISTKWRALNFLDSK